MMAALLRAQGRTLFSETVFEDRFRHVPALRAMGAQIELSGRRAFVHGTAKLHGTEMAATDLRGAAAMVCAALGAEGESRITQAWHLDRGYADFAARLRALGAEVRVEA
jgi:UDP-N-acetylglucosamine 1-carboxyvinyltransferase